jgi:hypothetical protein
MAQAGNELSDKCPYSIDRKTALGIVCIDVYLGFISLTVSQIESIYSLGGTATGSSRASLMRLNVQDTMSILPVIQRDIGRSIDY